MELFGYVLVHLILDRVGRKRPYFMFAIMFGIIALLILPVQKYMTKGSTGNYSNRCRTLRKFSYFMFVLAQVTTLNILLLTLRFLSSATYAIIYIYANELFPTNVRNTGMGMCSMVARVGAIIGTYCNDSLVSFKKFIRFYSIVNSFNQFI